MDLKLLNRRQWLKVMGLTGAAAMAGGPSVLAQDNPVLRPSNRRRVLRLGHLTDVHVEPERAADRGMAACLKHVQSQPDAPEFLLFGGDCVFETMNHDATRAKLQWDLWHTVLKDNCSLSAEFCIGNHDVWGWNHKKAATTGNEPLYGKKNAMHELGLASPFHSFDRAGWHFIILDSIFPNGESYQARLDEAQFAWLSDDLAKVPAATPVLVLSHIPIFSVTPMVDPKSTDGTDTTVSGGAMHEDFRRLIALFRQYPNVKLALSGHTHFIDRVDYLGVSYICDGAVSGNWWKGSHLGQCDPGYGLIDLYDDGTFDHQYITYGWKAVKSDRDV